MKNKPREETASEAFWSTVLTMLKIAVTILAIFTTLSFISIDHAPPVSQFHYPMVDN